jgi:hypothetical protein
LYCGPERMTASGPGKIEQSSTRAFFNITIGLVAVAWRCSQPLR